MDRFVLLMVVGSFMTAPLVQPAAGQEPLGVRVTINYRDAPAADVLGALAQAAGLSLEIGPGNLTPATITLTNVKLGTALSAVCENASCVWALVSTSDQPWHLKVTPLPTGRAALLPPSVSFDVYDTPVRDVFRALAAAIGVPATIDPGLSTEPVTMRLKNAMTAGLLNELCKQHRCDWDFDPTRGLRVTRKP